MHIPKDYEGREQSYFEHRVLSEYVLAWGLKLGSVARRRRVRLCYIDGFAGPWKSRSASLDDTSIAIGLRALEQAAATWRERGAAIDVEAAFVEENRTAFEELSRFLGNRAGVVKTYPHHGEFGEKVPALLAWLGADAALIFVDPTGWKGAAMRFVAPLIAGMPRRDVLVNVMFDHINRFKDNPRSFLREQMREFFGLGDGDMPARLDEEALFALYRVKLKELCDVRYAADLAIPHPTVDRTKFRLVVGGGDSAVLELFRSIEKKVIGAEAAVVRGGASTRERVARTGQLELGMPPPPTDARYDSLHDRGMRDARLALVAHVASGPVTFGDLWPGLLEAHHITKVELGRVAWDLAQRGEIVVMNKGPGERAMKDAHVLRPGQ